MAARNGRTGPDARRVLIVEITHGGTFGGSHQALYDLARHLDPARYRPIVMFYEDNPYAERLRGLGIRVVIWEAAWQREHGTRRRWFSPARVGSMASAVARRLAFIRRERIDLVHVNNSPSYGFYDWLPAARLAGVPIVTHLRGELYPIRNPAVRFLNHRFDRYIAISSYITGVLEAERFPRSRIVQVEDGIDVAQVRASVARPADEVRASLGVAPSRILAVMAGHLRSWKGQDVVLRALALLEPADRARIEVLFAGADDPIDRAYRRMLDELVQREGLQQCARFLGPRQDVPDLMNAADLVLHASTTPEPFGLVVLEGMALGRLVIASALGGPRQIVAEGSGWLFDPTRPDELAERLSRVLRAPELAVNVAAAARARAEEFTIGRTAARVQDVYDEVFP